MHSRKPQLSSFCICGRGTAHDYEIIFPFYNVVETQITVVQYFVTLTNHVSDKLLVIPRATSTEIAAL